MRDIDTQACVADPYGGEPTNNDRRKRARDSLEFYVTKTREEVWTEEDAQDSIADLITDLLHLAASLPEGDTGATMRQALMNFDAEHKNLEHER